MNSHLLTINYDATKKNNWRKVRDFVEHHTAAKFVGGGHYQNRGDLDFWCDESTGKEAIYLLQLYFDLSAYDVKFILNEVKPRRGVHKYRSPFTGKLV